MTTYRTLVLLRGGERGIKRWNRWRLEHQNAQVPDLSCANLRGAHLHSANLEGVCLREANFEGANLESANLKRAILSHANLKNSNLYRANLNDAMIESGNLEGADLCRSTLKGAKLDSAKLKKADFYWAHLDNADLTRADSEEANLVHADLQGASLGEASLARANLRYATLHRAHLYSTDLNGSTFKDADLTSAVFTQVILNEANLEGAMMGGTRFESTDLSRSKNLELARHIGPSSIDIPTLHSSCGKIPHVFLKGCGLNQWQAMNAKLFDPDLPAKDFDRMVYDISFARYQGPLVLGGVFVSHAHDDFRFVDKLERELKRLDIQVWRDARDAVAGSIQRQIDGAIWAHHVVVVVLSQKSLKSDWVLHEVSIARQKELKESRDVLCPIALDDAWKNKQSDVRWEHLMDKHIVDFSAWKTQKFNEQFKKLIKGMSIYYSREEIRH